MLSKSSILKGVQCQKYLWLYVNHPELQDPVSESRQATFNLGKQVGAMARDLFPGGFHATAVIGKPDLRSIKLTKDKIDEGEKVIYEACFEYEEVLIAVDILVASDKGWKIYEVKSTSEVKCEHYLDATVQWWVLNNNGLEMEDIFITHVDTSYLKNGDIDVQKYFKSESLKNKVEELQSKILSYVSQFKTLIQQPAEPDQVIGIYCSKPFPCSYQGRCWQHIPENSVFDIAGYKQEKKVELYSKGIVRMEDIPEEYPLSRDCKIQVDAYNQDQDHIEPQKIRNLMMDLMYPYYYLDFEGLYNLAIPIYDNSRPYQPIPFQYSLHVQKEKNGELIHYKFLADPISDPRIPFIENLLNVIGTSGSIIVFNKSYEGTRLNEICRDFPQYASRIQPLIQRIWDLMLVFQKKYFYRPTMKGSYSIKDVLPALVHNLSYDHLKIKDGGTASDQFLIMIQKGKTDKSYDEIKNDLLEYCELDTLAMVKLLEQLQKLTNA